MEIFQKRIDCYRDTTKLAKLYYPISTPSIKYIFDETFTFQPKYNTEIMVVNIDTIDAAIKFIEKKYSPLVLNLADDVMPGGCVEMGSGAQEESLFRRSNYFLSLQYNNQYYPIRFNEAIYSPKITVFKDNEANGWQLYSKPVVMDFIACPGLKYPKTEMQTLTQSDGDGDSNGIKRLCAGDIEILKNKIRLIFQIGYKNNHNVLILGALGCGAWRSPPEHVAEIFNEVCKEYNGMFRYVIFAVLRGSGDFVKSRYHVENYGIFSKYINCQNKNTKL
jgi:uncharacterized protein (TIGR02452 family)